MTCCTAPQLVVLTRSTSSDGPGPRSSMCIHSSLSTCRASTPGPHAKQAILALRSNPAQPRLHTANMQGSQLQAAPNVVQHTGGHQIGTLGTVGWNGGALYIVCAARLNLPTRYFVIAWSVRNIPGAPNCTQFLSISVRNQANTNITAIQTVYRPKLRNANVSSL
jgi:hypothetical protein